MPPTPWRSWPSLHGVIRDSLAVFGLGVGALSYALAIASSERDWMFWTAQQALLFPLMILSGMLLPLDVGPAECRSWPCSTRSPTPSRPSGRWPVGAFSDARAPSTRSRRIGHRYPISRHPVLPPARPRITDVHQWIDSYHARMDSVPNHVTTCDLRGHLSAVLGRVAAISLRDLPGSSSPVLRRARFASFPVLHGIASSSRSLTWRTTRGLGARANWRDSGRPGGSGSATTGSSTTSLTSV